MWGSLKFCSLISFCHFYGFQGIQETNPIIRKNNPLLLSSQKQEIEILLRMRYMYEKCRFHTKKTLMTWI